MKKIYKAFILLFFSVLLCFTFGCSKKTDVSSSKINIVCTNFPSYDFARAVIAGVNEDSTARSLKDSDFNVRLLIKPGMELHSFDPTPADIISIQNSDLFIYIGGESDEWVENILENCKKDSSKVLKLIEYVDALEEVSVEGMEVEAESEECEAEVEYDEHIWTSSVNAVKMINAILERVCQLDEENSSVYRQNAFEYCQRIKAVSAEIHKTVDDSANKTILMGDRFPFRYFAEEYGLEYRAAFSGCSSAVEAKTSTIAYLIDFAKANGIKTIFALELGNQKLARTIAEGCGASVSELHSCHNVSKRDFDSGITYLKTMENNLLVLQEGL